MLEELGPGRNLWLTSPHRLHHSLEVGLVQDPPSLRCLRDGLFRAIGVSNYEEAHVRELMATAEVLPAVNQFEVHPRRPATALRKACCDAGVCWG